MSRSLQPILFILISVLPFIHADSPYGVQKVGTAPNDDAIGAYSYDTAGNRLLNSTNVQTIEYGLIGKAVKISQGSFMSSINHGAAGRRYLRVDHEFTNKTTTKTFYLNGMDYKIDADDSVTTSIHINAKGYSSVAQVDINGGASPKYTYFVQDHLGSPLVSVKSDGTPAKPRRYDAWGQMTEATGEARTPKVDDDEKTRGYTGHEMMAKFNIGQWNGRIFDYEIGAFPQADKYIQGRSIAALNGYALGQHKNPNVTDPSGWMLHGDVFSHSRVRNTAHNILSGRGVTDPSPSRIITAFNDALDPHPNVARNNTSKIPIRFNRHDPSIFKEIRSDAVNRDRLWIDTIRSDTLEGIAESSFEGPQAVFNETHAAKHLHMEVHPNLEMSADKVNFSLSMETKEVKGRLQYKSLTLHVQEGVKVSNKAISPFAANSIENIIGLHQLLSTNLLPLEITEGIVQRMGTVSNKDFSAFVKEKIATKEWKDYLIKTNTTINLLNSN